MNDPTRTLTNGRPLKWTGVSAAVLQEAMYMSNERFAERLGASVRAVAGWHAKPRCVPSYEIQEALDTLLAMADDRTKERFASLFPLATAKPEIGQGPADDAEAVVSQWTGRTACVLQTALRLTNEQFAEHLGISTRTVVRWHANPDLAPRTEMQQLLDTTYAHASEPVRTRFAHQLASNEEPAVGVPLPAPVPPAAIDPVVAQMAADMALMQARIDSLQEKLGALALRVLT